MIDLPPHPENVTSGFLLQKKASKIVFWSNALQLTKEKKESLLPHPLIDLVPCAKVTVDPGH